MKSIVSVLYWLIAFAILWLLWPILKWLLLIVLAFIIFIFFKLVRGPKVYVNLEKTEKPKLDQDIIDVEVKIKDEKTND